VPFKLDVLEKYNSEIRAVDTVVGPVTVYRHSSH